MNSIRKEIWKYLIPTFAISWILQGIAAYLTIKGNAGYGQILIALVMFTPLLGVILSGHSLKGMGWNPEVRKNLKPLAFAWFVPAVITGLGVILYFLIFPSHLDFTGSYMIAAAGPEAIAQIEETGLSMPMMVLVSIAGCLTYAPLVNMLLAAGEETGWRGYLYPRLKELYGRKKGCLAGGIIWGMWHWPLIWLIGFNYGTGYIGFPITGMLIFCVFTTAFGILCDWVYEKSGSIWYPSVMHGAFNAIGTIPAVICIVQTGSYRLLGPAPIGLISGIPCLILALFLLHKQK